MMASSTNGNYILFRHLPEMRDHLDLDDLKLYLRAEDVLSDNDMVKLEVLPPHNTPDRAIHTLASLVKQKGDSGLRKFMAALRRSADKQPGHAELLQILETDEGTVEADSPFSIISTKPMAIPTEVPVHVRAAPVEDSSSVDLFPTRSHYVPPAYSDGIHVAAGNVNPLWLPYTRHHFTIIQQNPNQETVILRLLAGVFGILYLVIGIGGLIGLSWLECSFVGVQLFNFVNGIVLCYLGFVPYLSRLWYSRSYCFGLDFNSYRVFHYVLKCRTVALTLLTITTLLCIVMYVIIFMITACFYLLYFLRVYLGPLDPVNYKCSSLTFYSGFLPIGIVVLVIVVSFVVLLWRCGKDIYKAVGYSEQEYLNYISRSED